MKLTIWNTCLSTSAKRGNAQTSVSMMVPSAVGWASREVARSVSSKSRPVRYSPGGAAAEVACEVEVGEAALASRFLGGEQLDQRVSAVASARSRVGEVAVVGEARLRARARLAPFRGGGRCRRVAAVRWAGVVVDDGEVGGQIGGIAEPVAVGR